MNTCRLAVTAAFARGIPNFKAGRAAAWSGATTVYHAMPVGLCDGLRRRIVPAAFVDTATVQVDASLRRAALQGDWNTWAQAWTQLDRQACKDLLDQLSTAPGSRLTLCGERSAISFAVAAQPLWRRLQRRWERPSLMALQDLL